MAKAQVRLGEDGLYEVRFPDTKKIVRGVPAADAKQAVRKAREKINPSAHLPGIGRGPVQDWYTGLAKGLAVTAPEQMAGAVDWARGVPANLPYYASKVLPMSPEEEQPQYVPPPTGASDWVREKQEEHLPSLQGPAPGALGRVAEAAGSGLAWGLPFAPLAAAAGPGALALEAGAMVGAPALAQAERELGAPEAVAMPTEFIAGMAPAGAVRLGVSQAGKMAAKEAAEAAGQTVSRGAATRAARRVQADVGTPDTQARAMEATGQALEDFGPEGAPLPYQVLAGADPQVPGGKVGYRTRQLMGDEEYAREAASTVQRARDVTEEFGTATRPAGSAAEVPKRFRAEGDAQLAKARELYDVIPPESQTTAALSEIVAEFDDLVNEGTAATRVVMDEFFSRETKILNDLITRYGDADTIPVQELDDLLSSINATIRANKDHASHVGGRLARSVKNVMEISEERAKAKAKWAATKQTFEPEPPRRGKRATEQQRTEYAAAQAIGGNVEGVARRIIKPTGGVSSRQVAKQAKKIFGDDPAAMQDLKAAFADEIFGTAKPVSPNVFAQRVRNKRIRKPYEDLFGEEDWPQFEKLMRMRNQSEYSQLARAGESLTTGSGVTAQSVSELTSLAVRAKAGDIGAIARLGARVLKGRFGDNDAAKLYRLAMRDTELFDAFMRLGPLGPEEWAEGIGRVAARHGIIIAGKETL